jgi:hypothetical protein
MVDPALIQQFLSALPQGQAALDLVGMPRSHGVAFEQVARQEKCVISSRELGKVGTMLVEEGYDSKGFRIKSKTCNFGPMAGFVCYNPTFSKKGVGYAKKQKEDIDHALHGDNKQDWKASTEQICISDQRLDWLKREKSVKVAPQASVSPTMVWGQINDPAPVRWVAKKKAHVLTGEMVWHLYEAPDNVMLHGSFNTLEKHLTPMLALVNPYPAYPKGHYKNCVCGDYDLFAVWPQWQNFSPTGEDRRIAGMNPNAQVRNQQILQWEDKRLGNISNRVHQVAQMLNSLMPPAPGAIGAARDMVHHSDEAGRPFVTEIELPVIAFIPAKTRTLCVGARDLHQMKKLISLCHALGFQIIINEGWRAQLGMHGALGHGTDSQGWQVPQNSPLRAR